MVLAKILKAMAARALMIFNVLLDIVMVLVKITLMELVVLV